MVMLHLFVLAWQEWERSETRGKSPLPPPPTLMEFVCKTPQQCSTSSCLHSRPSLSCMNFPRRRLASTTWSIKHQNPMQWSKESLIIQLPKKCTNIFALVLQQCMIFYILPRQPGEFVSKLPNGPSAPPPFSRNRDLFSASASWAEYE